MPAPPIPVVMAAPAEDTTRRIARLVGTVRKMGATDFSDTINPMEAEDWLQEIMLYYDGLQIILENRVGCILFLLKNDARLWWREVRNRQMDANVVTWDFFVEQFRAYYVPQIFTEQKIREFMNLQQHQMTVDEYKSRFHQLSRYTTSLVPTEEDRCRHFIEGLSPVIQRQVVATDYAGFNSLIKKAIRVEEVIIREESGLGKRTRDSSAPGEGSSRFHKN